MSTRTYLALVAALAATGAYAQAALPRFDLERLDLDPAARGSLVVGTGQIAPEPGESRIALGLQWERDPLTITSSGYVRGHGAGIGGSELGSMVRDRLTLHLLGAVTVFPRVEVNFAIPAVAWQRGDAIAGYAELRTPGVGTPRLGMKVGVLQQAAGQGLDLALAADVRAPWGNQLAVAGNTGLSFAPRLELGMTFSGLLIGANAGVLLRAHKVTFPNDKVLQHELRGGLTMSTRGEFRVELSGLGQYSFDHYSQDVEALAGVRYLPGVFELFALGGPGFFETPGTPTWRAMVGVAVNLKPPPPPAPPPPPPPDPCAPGNAHTPAQCPTLDDDGDGIPNGQDRCPLVKGIAENHGCPDVDTDGDGVVDRFDKCPNDKGPAENSGCPEVDSDKDGVPDRLDKCPNEPGAVEYQGCPPPARAEIKTGTIALNEPVFFDTGKATLQRRSYPLLDDVATVLTAHPEVSKIEIQGHTDNTGNAKKNLALSQARANAVKDYLVGKGVAPGRLTAKGYGQTQPVVKNNTRANREKNRRVEFVVQ
jgi:OmpA-OmpF porin, OOP family